MTHWPSLSWPGVVTATSLVVITLLSAVFVWQPPGPSSVLLLRVCGMYDHDAVQATLTGGK
jgi:hypothetical protein